MAVAKMKLVEIVGKLDDLDNVIEICGRFGDFQPESAMSHVANVKGFVPLTEDNPYSADLQKLNDIAGPSQKTFQFTDYSDLNMKPSDITAYVNTLAAQIRSLQEREQTLQQAAAQNRQAIAQLEHFMSLDVALNSVFECNFIKVRFGRIPRESYEKLADYNDNPYVFFLPCSHDTAHYWGIYVAPVEQIREIDRIFSTLYFERLRVPNSSGTPRETAEKMNAELKQTKEKLIQVKTELNTVWEKEFSTCEKIYSLLTDKQILFSARKYGVRYSDKFYYLGWIPKTQAKDFSHKFDDLDVDIKIVNPDVKLSAPPTKLNNWRFFKPFEFFIDMYGLPSYDEFDPTPFVAVTYILLFGLMFADLGQGLCITLAGWFMYRFKDMKLGKALIPCGICSSIMGFLFGSVFGYEHALDWFYCGILGMASKPIDVMESNTTITIIAAAVGLGVVLVLCAMGLNIYSCFKRKRYGEALFGCNGISGMVFYASLIGLAVCQLAFGIPVFNWATISFLLVLPLLLMFFREPLSAVTEHEKWKPEGWGDFFIQNFFEVFEFLLSYLSNTVSFLRVSAFILVHAGMMMAILALAEMAGSLGFIVIIIGNIFVIALEGLLAGIQALRLEYYEMFSRFFEGGGRPFEPIRLKNKKITK